MAVWVSRRGGRGGRGGRQQQEAEQAAGGAPEANQSIQLGYGLAGGSSRVSCLRNWKLLEHAGREGSC